MSIKFFRFSSQLCAKGAEDMAGFGDIICEHFTWGSTGKFYLHDDKGAVSINEYILKIMTLNMKNVTIKNF